MEKQRKNTRRNKGITLIALVITVIILLILAGISIAELTGTGIFSKAKEAKEKYKDAEELENQTLAEYEKMLNNLGGSNPSGSGGGDEQGDDPNVPQTNIDEAKDYVSENTEVTDECGNTLIVPEGFKITDDASNVTEGIVIEDKEGNQFVWIPVGTVIDTSKQQHTIKLSRYTFNSSGEEIDQGDNVINEVTLASFQELSESTYGNTVAKDIVEFKNSVEKNNGYYIGRYEARDGKTESARTSSTSDDNQLVCKADAYVYNYITQPQAATLCTNMYQNKSTFICDLMNSYAYDTALVFFQTFDNRSNKSKPYSSYSASVGGALKEKGGFIVPGFGEDKICNVFDFATNYGEATTETCTKIDERFSHKVGATTRGGTGSHVGSGAKNREGLMHYEEEVGFRPILYINN